MHTVNRLISHFEDMLDSDRNICLSFSLKSNEIIYVNRTTCCCIDYMIKKFSTRKNLSNINDGYRLKKRVRNNSFGGLGQNFNQYLLAFFYIWIVMLHLQPKVIKAAPIHASSNVNNRTLSPSDFKAALSPLLHNPCGYEKDMYGFKTQESSTRDNLNIKSLLGTIESSSKTGLSDFNEKVLKSFLQSNFNKSIAMKDDHHDEWKHRFNPKLHPNETQLDIDFSKDLFDSKKDSTRQAARNFNIKNINELMETLHNCDDRLQRLLVAFYGMIINLENSDINFRNESATNIAREDYANATDIIRGRLCDVRYVLNELHNFGNVDSEMNDELQELGHETSEINNFPFRIVHDDSIYRDLFEADTILDWVNIRQLHDQLKYMTQIFSIWANEINLNDSS